MNRDLALTPDEGAWPVQPYDPATQLARPREQGPMLDLPTLLRIIREWRWLIGGCVAAGIALAIAYALLTTPMYRSWVMLQVNPPTVEILDESSAGAEPETPWDYVATQVGLLSSRTLAERVAQDLNLVNNADFVDQSLDPARRLQAATTKITQGLAVVPPAEGQLIQFSFSSDSPRLSAQIGNGIAEAFINSNLQRRYESSAYARNFLERQIAKTRTDLEKSERELVAYAQAEGIINTATGGATALASDATSPQGESLQSINRALSDATARRVAAEGTYRAALNSGITSTETASSQAIRQSRAAVAAQYQQKRTMMKPDHPEMVSLRSQIE